MTPEPTEADKAAAEAIASWLGVDVSDLIEAERDDLIPTPYFASIIAQHMAPERQAAAELREENAAMRKQLSDFMEADSKAVSVAFQEIDRLKSELSEARQEVELLKAGYDHLGWELPKRGPNGSVSILQKPGRKSKG